MPKFWIEKDDGRGVQYSKALPWYRFGYNEGFSSTYVGCIFLNSDKTYDVLWSIKRREVFYTFAEARAFAELVTSLEY